MADAGSTGAKLVQKQLHENTCGHEKGFLECWLVSDAMSGNIHWNQMWLAWLQSSHSRYLCWIYAVKMWPPSQDVLDRLRAYQQTEIAARVNEEHWQPARLTSEHRKTPTCLMKLSSSHKNQQMKKWSTTLIPHLNNANAKFNFNLLFNGKSFVV